MSVSRVFASIPKNGLGLKMASSLNKSAVASSVSANQSLFNQSWYQAPISNSLYHARSYHHMSRQNNLTMCTCSSCRRLATGSPLGLHTKVDKDLSVFLKSEVDAERQLSKAPKHGPGVPGFEVETKGANVTLTRKQASETIVVKFNVNGVLDTEDPEPSETSEGQPPMPDMRARPDFVVEVSKPNGRILAFTCRLIEEDPSQEGAAAQEGPQDDKFEIESFTVLNAEEIDEEGDWDENIYMADGAIIDGQMYDLLLGFLESRGINNDFIEAFMDYATFYEHSNYIGLLEKLRDFVDK